MGYLEKLLLKFYQFLQKQELTEAGLDIQGICIFVERIGDRMIFIELIG